MSEILAINDENFIAEVIDSDRPVLMDCWAAWCGPCRMMAPELEALAEEESGRLKIVKLDVDEHPGIAHLLGVTVLPTVVLFIDGVVEASAAGFRPKDATLALFEPHLPKKKSRT
jgi:thioredoxin 1